MSNGLDGTWKANLVSLEIPEGRDYAMLNLAFNRWVGRRTDDQGNEIKQPTAYSTGFVRGDLLALIKAYPGMFVAGAELEVSGYYETVRREYNGQKISSLQLKITDIAVTSRTLLKNAGITPMGRKGNYNQQNQANNGNGGFAGQGSNSNDGWDSGNQNNGTAQQENSSWEQPAANNSSNAVDEDPWG